MTPSSDARAALVERLKKEAAVYNHIAIHGKPLLAKLLLEAAAALSDAPVQSVLGRSYVRPDVSVQDDLADAPVPQDYDGPEPDINNELAPQYRKAADAPVPSTMPQGNPAHPDFCPVASPACTYPSCRCAVPPAREEETAMLEKLHTLFHEFAGTTCRTDGGWCDARDHAEAAAALYPAKNTPEWRDRLPAVPALREPEIRDKALKFTRQWTIDCGDKWDEDSEAVDWSSDDNLAARLVRFVQSFTPEGTK